MGFEPWDSLSFVSPVGGRSGGIDGAGTAMERAGSSRLGVGARVRLPSASSGGQGSNTRDEARSADTDRHQAS